MHTDDPTFQKAVDDINEMIRKRKAMARIRRAIGAVVVIMVVSTCVIALTKTSA